MLCLAASRHLTGEPAEARSTPAGSGQRAGLGWYPKSSALRAQFCPGFVVRTNLDQSIGPT